MNATLPENWRAIPVSNENDWRSAVCVYCGEKQDDKDHIPPQSMFTPTSKLGEMLTVPSCSKCNKGFSDCGDDDRFRNLMAHWCATENKIADELLKGKVERSGKYRPDLLKQDSNRTRLLEQFSKSGIYIGTKKETFPFSEEEELCITRMADRISRGLYWIYAKRPAPQRYSTKLATPDEVNRVEPSFLEALKGAPWVSKTNPEVFMSKSIASSIEMHHLISMLVFYKKFTLLVFFGAAKESDL